MTSFLWKGPLSSGSLMKSRVLSMQKVITDKDTPPKAKHVRAIILTTFEERSSSFFYTYISERSILSTPVVCWKFLYIVYKLLRCGHPECIKDGIRNASKICQYQSSWMESSINTSYRLMDFFQLVIKRLKLHRKYSILPGTLELSSREVAMALQALPDHLFQFSADLMDFLEEILHFSHCVLRVLNVDHGIICTPLTQCKMTPLLLCLQDGAAVYDLVVHILFKLHELLGNNAMNAHRIRFNNLHFQLATFFHNASCIHYFKAFVQIPTLSEDPPNFTVRTELDRLTCLRISINESHSSGDESDHSPLEAAVNGGNVEFVPASTDSKDNQLVPVEDTLLKTFDASPHKEQQTVTDSSLVSQPSECTFQQNFRQLTPSNHECLLESELLKSEIHTMKDEHQKTVNSLVERIKTLECEIQDAVQQKSLQDEHCDRLELDMRAHMNRAASFEEKFLKLKHAYSKLREEHVSALQNLSTARNKILESEHHNQSMVERIQVIESQLKKLSKRQQCQSTVVHENGDMVTSDGKSNDYVVSAKQSRKPIIEASNQHEAASEPSWLYVSEVTSDEDTDLSACFHEAIKSPQAHLLSRICIRAVERIREFHIAADYHTPSTNSLDGIQFALGTVIDSAVQFKEVLQNPSISNTDEEFMLKLFDLTSCLFTVLLHFQGSSALKENEDLMAVVTGLPTICISLFQTLTTDPAAATEQISLLLSSMEQTNSLVTQLQASREISKQSEHSEWLALLNEEMGEAENVMAKAENKFKDLAAAKVSPQLRVNQQILGHCSALIAAVRHLVLKSKEIQLLIRDTTTNPDSYKRQGCWTQGFLSAAKSVGACANVLIEIADELVSGREHVFERLLVVAQEVSASTTQLFVASRVRLPSDSSQLSELQLAVRAVSQATGDLVASVKSAMVTQETLELDFSGLTLTQTKRLQVESQVRVLTLEKALEDERYQLSQLRKHNYRNEADVDEQILDE